SADVCSADLRDARRACFPVNRPISRRDRREREGGQAIVVMIGAILVTVAMGAPIVDGGSVLAQQRGSQTAAGATAEAGAVILAERLSGVTEPSGGWDLNIWNRINQTAAA